MRLTSLRLIVPASVLIAFAAAALFRPSPGSAKPDAPPAATDRLVVHEWGTFTSLQDEDGVAIGGINTDDEPVPAFVHDISGWFTPGPEELPTVLFKAVPRNHPDVYTRLETPVVYFYPPAGEPEMTVDVEVTFKGGWLTQFYPDAVPGGPGVREGRLEFARMNHKARGSLEWRDLKIGGNADGPQTDDRVWLAPRNVPAAASVLTPAGERERYLFYRGVGQITAPLKVSRHASSTAPGGEELHVRSQWGNWMRMEPGFGLGPLWLVSVRPDGTSAFRTVEKVDLSRGEQEVLATIPANFSDAEHSADNLPKLREAMHAALVRDGLFPDEATAMLDTWEVSYFKRPGLRLFFNVPRQWTENYLPLTVSRSADITRVMIGRIELVTPQQRALLAKIAAGPVSDPQWVHRAIEQLGGNSTDAYREDFYRQVNRGGSSILESRGVQIPDDYRAYLSLGRFRNALVNDELRRRPTDALSRFVEVYQLEPYSFDGQQ